MVSDAWKEVYHDETSNSIITAGSTQQFGNSENAKGQKVKYGSYNSLVFTYLGSPALAVYLDDNRLLFRLLGAGSIVIDPKDGKFFDWITIKNLDGAAQVDADLITVSCIIAKPLDDLQKKKK
jgi:hypothetical protein